MTSVYAVKYWSKATGLDPFYGQLLENHFDAGIQAVSRGVVHDHFAQKYCYGLLFIGEDKIVYRCRLTLKKFVDVRFVEASAAAKSSAARFSYPAVPGSTLRSELLHPVPGEPYGPGPNQLDKGSWGASFDS